MEFKVANPAMSSKRPKLVGNFIRQRREALNLSQRALGMLFDPPVTTQFISNVERGVTPLPPAHVPTLTKALQVSEAEMMSLLEKEYTMQLSGRLGLTEELTERTIAIIPGHDGSMSQKPQFEVSPNDLKFMRELYNAFQCADSQTRQTFTNLCESVLNLPRS